MLQNPVTSNHRACICSCLFAHAALQTWNIAPGTKKLTHFHNCTEPCKTPANIRHRNCAFFQEALQTWSVAIYKRPQPKLSRDGEHETQETSVLPCNFDITT